METTLGKDGKLGWKMHKKFLYKLNKQQTELWRHVANFSQLFFINSTSLEIREMKEFLMETTWKWREYIQGKRTGICLLTV